VAARQDEFAHLYSSYRIDDMASWNRARSRWERARRNRLALSVPVLLGGAAIAETLVATGKGGGVLGAGLALACAVAALALATGIVASASAAHETSRARQDVQAALTSIPRPGPGATEQERAAWVNQVEAILGQARPGSGESIAV
jgi:hypothetical protein